MFAVYFSSGSDQKGKIEYFLSKKKPVIYFMLCDAERGKHDNNDNNIKFFVFEN